jgi:hypothetical protein
LQTNNLIKIKSDILKIGWYQIIGGLTGIAIILFSFIGSSQLQGVNVLVFLFMFSFYFYSVFCGVLCLQLKEIAIIYSLINQFLQLIGFAIFGFAFYYVAGVYVSIGFDFTNSMLLKFNFGISKFDFTINQELERAQINLNLIAFALIYWIDKLRKKIKIENENML